MNASCTGVSAAPAARDELSVEGHRAEAAHADAAALFGAGEAEIVAEDVNEPAPGGNVDLATRAVHGQADAMRAHAASGTA
jgi:hypothetical protein